MSRFTQLDILSELTDLSRELVNQIRQLLNYYRVSVYKAEMSEQIKAKTEQLRLLARLTGDELFYEPFCDLDAMIKAGASACISGECPLSSRTSMLLQALESSLDQLETKVRARELTEQDPLAFTTNVRKHRHELVAICRHGSRQHAFFQTL